MVYAYTLHYYTYISRIYNIYIDTQNLLVGYVGLGDSIDVAAFFTCPLLYRGIVSSQIKVQFKKAKCMDKSRDYNEIIIYFQYKKTEEQKQTPSATEKVRRSTKRKVESEGRARNYNARTINQTRARNEQAREREPKSGGNGMDTAQ